MTTVEPVAGRLQALMSTTPVVDKVPIPKHVQDAIAADLRVLCQKWTTQLVADEDATGSGGGEDMSKRAVTSMVTVAEAIAVEAKALQEWLWAEAERRGVTKTAVARARGVTQQAMTRARKRTTT